MPTNIDRYLNQIRTAVYGKQVRSAIADGIEECYNRDTQENPLIVRKEVLATEFNANNNYTKGEFVFYEGDIYIFTADHPAGAWKIDNPDAVVITLADAIVEKADKADTVLETTLSRGRTAGTTVGTASMAFGNDVEASGYGSHAGGHQTIANSKYQHVFGDYNIADPNTNVSAKGTYIEIVGNGTGSNARSNARTLDWSGNEELAGSLTFDGSLSCNRASGETVGNYSIAHGSGPIASEYCSYAQGIHTTASGRGAHAEGATTEASGEASHAEGSGAIASGEAAHSEGMETTASGDYGHAEGYQTNASEYAAHAEGTMTVASGDSSHAEGIRTTANHIGQHVFGINNIVDDSTTLQGTYVEIVGNGDPNNATPKSNARTLDWNGNEALAGDLTLNMGTNNEVSVLTALTTLQNQMADLLYEAIKFNSCTVTPSLALIGTTVSSVTIAWDLNKLPTTLKLDNVAVPSNKLIQNGSMEKTGTWTATTTFTMVATDERDTAITSKPKLTFGKNVYYGVADLNNNPNSAFVTGLTAELRTNKKPSFTVNAGTNKYVYYAVPTSYGACTFAVGGFSGGFEAAKTVSVTYPNTSHTENYYVYRSTNHSIGSTTITVS